MLLLATAPSGSVCSQVHQQTTTICLTSSRPPDLGNGCTQPVLGRSRPLCLPTSSHPGQSGGEIPGLPIQQDHTVCTRVAEHALVLGPSGHVQPDPTVPAQSGVSTIQPDPAQESVKSEATYLATAIRSRASLRHWQQELRLLKEDQPEPSMMQSGPFLQSGNSVIRWTSVDHV